MIQATFKSYTQQENAKQFIVTLVFSGNTGAQGVGDLVNLGPYEPGSNPNGILDPDGKYDNILNFPPGNVGVFSEALAGYYIQIQKNAVPTLANLGIRLFAPGGGEVAAATAYAGLAGWPGNAAASAQLVLDLPLQ